MKKLIFVIYLIILNNLSPAQNISSLSGIVRDNTGNPLPGCHIHIFDSICHITDTKGAFLISDITQPDIKLTVSYVGYITLDTTIILSGHYHVIITLHEDLKTMGEVVIHGSRIDTTKSLKNEVIDAAFMTKNLSGTFVKALEKLPGVNSMDIGANSSKPVIRGMGFNRVVVTEGGIKQEGQQWGADHGIEIDPFAIETAEIVKGASSIEHGSEAIGGYINIINDELPAEEKITGSLNLLGKTINNTLGGSLFLQSRKNHFYYKIRGTYIGFGDYYVPVDTITYLTRNIPVYNNHLKNTAGMESDFFIQTGYLSSAYKTSISFSSVYQKSGFFPGSHGIPDLSRVSDDHNARNIDYPYQKIRHIKIINNHELSISGGTLFADFGFQHNKRGEWSYFHTHFPGQEPPDVNPDMEQHFDLITYSVNAKYKKDLSTRQTITLGTQNQWKNNTIDGYGYFMPEYTSQSYGVFIKDDIRFSDKWGINAGIRYDYQHINTKGFYDDILYDFLISTGTEQGQATDYANRSTDNKGVYQNISWLLGMTYSPWPHTLMRVNAGKSFRSPNAIELSSNGIHHGSFRHETGNPNLRSEEGYYIDGNVEWGRNSSLISLSSYLYYFTNYIFLNPTGNWSILPDGGQIYEYTESKAMLSGIEAGLSHKFGSSFKAEANLEYIFNKQINEDASLEYPLPFTPPLNGYVELNYLVTDKSSFMENTTVFLHSKFALEQQRISRNEETTDGYILFGVGVESTIHMGIPVEIVLRLDNIFNTKYFNHISFYRKLNIPEQGRNIQMHIKIPINIHMGQ